MSPRLWTALALMLVLEGMVPFVVPGLWRQVFSRLLSLSDGQLRAGGLGIMILGLLLLTQLPTD